MTTSDEIAIAGLVVGVITLIAAAVSVAYAAKAARTADRQLDLQRQAEAEQQERERLRRLLARHAEVTAGLIRSGPGQWQLTVFNSGWSDAAITRVLIDGQPAAESERIRYVAPVAPLQRGVTLYFAGRGSLQPGDKIDVSIDWIDDAGPGHWETRLLV